MNDALLDYHAFLTDKSHSGSMHGFTPDALPDFLFDFQHSLVGWALRKGRAALFADCGLGKTGMELAWADAIVQRENRHVLILAPLAVASQTIREAAKFGIEAVHSTNGTLPPRATTIVTNYERLHYFRPEDFVGVVCDESSILKSFNGARRGEITQFMRKHSYRLLGTATAAPNDHTELGTSSEALGELGHMDVLNRFFKNDMNNSAVGRHHGKAMAWRFKGHAEEAFWRWVSSWARALRRPSDLGFSDARFVLPPLTEVEHVVESNTLAEGWLFAAPAVGLAEQREEQRRTLKERCDKVASLVADTGQPALVWCHLNAEGDRLEQSIPDAIQVSGSDSDDAKEEKLLAFANGEARVLVTKPKIGAWGLNFQHCAHVTVFPSHSFEQYYQCVRRCWRFGQTRPVRVDHVTTEGARGIKDNMQRKSDAANRQFTALAVHMNNALTIDRQRVASLAVEVPSWLR